MPIQLKKVRIFMASPGDVQSERAQLSKLKDELNLTVSALAPEKGIVLELWSSDTHVHPGIGADAQKVVNAQIGEYDIFVGMMWKSLGTRTTTAVSGTAEELQLAYEKWQKDASFPVLFYFCQQPFMPQTRAEVKKFTKVVAFREDLAKRGFLLGDYEDHESFADKVRRDLLLVLGKMFSSKGSTMDAAERVGEHTGSAQIAVVRSQILALAKEYEETRRAMPSGNERTRAMELIASRMRSFALPAYPLLPELVESASAGVRLAAISMLESIPIPHYLPWLADRVLTEKPFLGYHSTVALIQAARNLQGLHPREVQKAITQARDNLTTLKWRDPNQMHVLEQAEKEIERAKHPTVHG